MRARDELLEQVIVLRGQVLGISARIRELRFPSGAPVSLVDLIERLVRKVAGTVEGEAANASLDNRQFDRRLRFAIRGLERLAAHLRFAERAAAPQVQPGSVRTLVRVAEELFPGSRFIFRPQWTFNYSQRELVSTYRGMFVDNDFGLLREDEYAEIVTLSSIRAQDGFYVFGFPRVEKDSVLCHVALGHELGHKYAEEFLENPLAGQFLGHVIKQAADTTGRTGDNPLVEDESELGDAGSAGEILCSRALQETIADLTGLHLFGFAALAYTARIGLLNELDEAQRIPATEHYPPWRFRLRTMIRAVPQHWFEQFLQLGQFPENPKALVVMSWKKLLDIVEPQSDVEGLQRAPKLRIAYEGLEQLMEAAVDFLNNELGAKGISIDSIPGMAHWRLVEALLLGFPPDRYEAEDGEKIATVCGILNAGWIARSLQIQAYLLRPSIAQLINNHISDRDIQEAIANTPKLDPESLYFKESCYEKLVLGLEPEQYTCDDTNAPQEVLSCLSEHITKEWISKSLIAAEDEADVDTRAKFLNDDGLLAKLELQQRLTEKALEYSDLWHWWSQAKMRKVAGKQDADPN